MAQLTSGEQRLRVTLEGDVLFDTAKWELKPAALAILQNLEDAYVRRTFYFDVKGSGIANQPGCP